MNKKGMRITKPVVLLILDGWGDRADGEGNAIADARTPTWDSLMANTPHCLLICSGEDVGLPKGQMGNSEVGHLTIGAGRVIDQDLTRISKAIEQGDFFENPVLKDALDRAQKNHRAVHVLGLLSPGGVHSHEEHLFACLQMAQRHHCERIYLHAFLDGRDTPPQSAKASIEKCETLLKTIPQARLASVCGRYYAMDRDKRWDRIKLAYDLIAHGSAPYKAHSGIEALEKAYARSETDEFVKPTAILTSNNECSIVSPGDLIIFMNFRSDRARELTEAFISPQFTAFDRGFIPIGEFVSLTEYDKTFNTSIGFPPQSHANGLTEYLSKQHLKQLHLAETEKYAHVTFFFNGGIEKAFPGEERILIPSPKIATYDLQPEMSAPALTDALVENILNQQFDFIVCNYANADMLGHTGNLNATIQAIETLDHCLAKIIQALDKVNGDLLITADHGNAECMVDPQTKGPHTAHTLALVPLVYVGKQKITFENKTGKLSDVAPTVLSLMKLNIPAEMSGHSLIKPLK